MDQPPISLSSYWQLVRSNRNFRLLWFAQIVSEMGDWLYAIAIYSLLLEVTGTAKSVALAVVLQELPQCLVAPAAGVLNDRLSRKKIMITADLAQAAIVLLMIVVIDRGWVWLIYLLLLAETVMWAFFEPARTAVVATITCGRDLLVANALASTTWSFILAVGSALGGLATAAFGRNVVLVVNALTFVASALLVSAMRFKEPHLDNVPAFRWRDLGDFRPVFEGVRYVASDRRLLATMLVKTGLGLLGTSWVLLPVLGERFFRYPGAGLDSSQSAMIGMSLLLAARGVGALLGPIVSSYWAGGSPPRLRLGILYGFLANMGGFIALGLADSLPTAILAVILSHAGGSTVWVFSTTLLQQQAEDHFRGRVFSADYAFFVIAMSAVSYGAGMLVDLGMSAKTVAILSGMVGLIPVFGWARALRMWQPARSLADYRNP